MAKIRGSVIINKQYCKGCELCVYECPQDSLKMSSKLNTKGYHYALLAEDTCTGCINCALVCPDACITVYRKTKKNHFSTEKITTNSSSKMALKAL
ncbi:MAG: ferredoxin family protein [Candidatus Marinimicrobia bacterium]|nr:ferredoxin family protein [Candidatus Neomarinimicrobiota bacterium]